MSYSIVYSSQTGNTKQLAETLRETLPQEAAATSAHRQKPQRRPTPCMWASGPTGAMQMQTATPF